MSKAETQWSPDTCACVIRYETDLQNLDAEPVATRVVKSCEVHAEYQNDPQALLDAILTENRNKNIQLTKFAKELGVHPEQVRFSFDESRTPRFEVATPKLPPQTP